MTFPTEVIQPCLAKKGDKTIVTLFSMSGCERNEVAAVLLSELGAVDTEWIYFVHSLFISLGNTFLRSGI